MKFLRPVGILILTVLLSAASGGSTGIASMNKDCSSSLSGSPELQYGYIKAADAIKVFNETNQQKIKLPSNIPFDVTQCFGRLSDGQKSLELKYLNEETKEIYKLLLSTEPSSKTREMSRDKVIHLSDGTKAFYKSYDRFMYQFGYQKDGLSYMMMIGTNTKKKITPQTFLEVANSMM